MSLINLKKVGNIIYEKKILDQATKNQQKYPFKKLAMLANFDSYSSLPGSVVIFTGMVFGRWYTIHLEKPLEMPDWNLLCLRRKWSICLLFQCTEKKSPNLYAKKFAGLLVNNNKIVN